jgi:biopolymer transport protein ExbB
MNRASFCLLILAAITAPLVLAQDADQPAAAVAANVLSEAPTEAPVAEDPVADTETAKPVTTQSIGGMVVSGGILNVVFFGILGVFSLWAATVVLERIVNLKRDRLLPETFAKQLAPLLDPPQSNASRFKTLCESHNAPASRIFFAGVLRAGRPLPEVEKAMEDAAAREMALIRAKSRPLGVVGNVAPLVGLLGTVVGMIMAFQISSQEGLGKAERLAEGIYLALMTTAAGLTIAIPCLLFASWFTGRAERYMCDIGECLSRTMPSFARMEGKSVASGSVSVSGAVAENHELSPRERFVMEAGEEV